MEALKENKGVFFRRETFFSLSIWLIILLTSQTSGCLFHLAAEGSTLP